MNSSRINGVTRKDDSDTTIELEHKETEREIKARKQREELNEKLMRTKQRMKQEDSYVPPKKGMRTTKTFVPIQINLKKSVVVTGTNDKSNDVIEDLFGRDDEMASTSSESQMARAFDSSIDGSVTNSPPKLAEDESEANIVTVTNELSTNESHVSGTSVASNEVKNHESQVEVISEAIVNLEEPKETDSHESAGKESPPVEQTDTSLKETEQVTCQENGINVNTNIASESCSENETKANEIKATETHENQSEVKSAEAPLSSLANEPGITLDAPQTDDLSDMGILLELGFPNHQETTNDRSSKESNEQSDAGQLEQPNGQGKTAIEEEMNQSQADSGNQIDTEQAKVSSEVDNKPEADPSSQTISSQGQIDSIKVLESEADAQKESPKKSTDSTDPNAPNQEAAQSEEANKSSEQVRKRKQRHVYCLPHFIKQIFIQAYYLSQLTIANSSDKQVVTTDDIVKDVVNFGVLNPTCEDYDIDEDELIEFFENSINAIDAEHAEKSENSVPEKAVKEKKDDNSKLN